MYSSIKPVYLQLVKKKPLYDENSRGPVRRVRPLEALGWTWINHGEQLTDKEPLGNVTMEARKKKGGLAADMEGQNR